MGAGVTSKDKTPGLPPCPREHHHSGEASHCVVRTLQQPYGGTPLVRTLGLWPTAGHWSLLEAGPLAAVRPSNDFSLVTSCWQLR